MTESNITNLIHDYKNNYITSINKDVELKIQQLLDLIIDQWRNEFNIYLIGNGGSGSNANHIANDFLYGAGIANKKGIKVESLVSNSAVLSCLANDVGYESIFSEQLKVKASKNDLLIALSGSGNSPNIIKALNEAKKINMKTFAILGFDGGEAKKIVNNFIHFPLNDMQVVEDLQMFIFHLCSKWLSKINLDK